MPRLSSRLLLALLLCGLTPSIGWSTGRLLPTDRRARWQGCRSARLTAATEGSSSSDEGLGSGERVAAPGGGGGGSALMENADFSVNTILKQLESIQQGTPKNIVILGTRHCSFLHQQIIELLSYALVLSENHLYTSGATGTHAAAIRGALRAENQELLTVILPQTIGRQPREIRELLGQVKNVVELGHDELPLDAASRICNSELLALGDQLVVFAFHDSNTLRETIEEAKALSLLVTTLYLD
ncbi:hypothetical protein EMIHUDRAFT_415611 [Emiliania huxleyi CCMP1516]|uniref:SIS domain-containing protein n=2 Tax=Emiliania huxleyi TaxID=2903 RepID=A0A0D3JSJ7_EMIH1|nr:hypothetical protein EMIHUDRAFT_415611 [Emiliania huxleyi CCMP1516]EOD26482.1 hypothetical protein EMIHUDRAFT_415611 [Emiliania huxleyi CCMP1516]|mmetsp:Transcript_33242/g.107362  ORF Transcript_33242/g.107362 Transcript_33242/m.107362 type:complete len:243 (-) Transcript_33242:74-802(-)|eukprot:XP_005778911.1 hypothetical protein EMIHUDRAFT_415611 [Emiliania huxleyi CCMP1516]